MITDEQMKYLREHLTPLGVGYYIRTRHGGACSGCRRLRSTAINFNNEIELRKVLGLFPFA